MDFMRMIDTSTGEMIIPVEQSTQEMSSLIFIAGIMIFLFVYSYLSNKKTQNQIAQSQKRMNELLFNLSHPSYNFQEARLSMRVKPKIFQRKEIQGSLGPNLTRGRHLRSVPNPQAEVIEMGKVLQFKPNYRSVRK